MKTRTTKNPASKCQSQTKRTTISLDADVLTNGNSRAKKLRRNFSNYVETLIATDLELAEPTK